MELRQTSHTGIAAVLILLGLGFLLFQFVPTPEGGSWLENTWPLTLLAVGIVLLVLGSVRHLPGLAIPAAILACLGTLLFWQNTTWNWESWAYVWTLIPGFVGLGLALEVPLGGATPLLGRGEALIVLSLGLFALFTTFYSTIGLVDSFWPVSSIALGVLLFFRSLILLRSQPHTPRAAAPQRAPQITHLHRRALEGR